RWRWKIPPQTPVRTSNGTSGSLPTFRPKNPRILSSSGTPLDDMQGRRFLDLAREIFAGGSEVHWRGCAGRAYYGLVLECRDALQRWGFPPPPRDRMHAVVRLRFVYATAVADLRFIGDALDELIRLRNKADYDLSALAAFATDRRARNALDLAQ